MSTFNPSIVQDSLLKMMPMYTRINDCIAGSDVIKAKKDEYLPRPDPTNEDDSNLERYDQYIERAIFYNVTARTVNGMVGMVFSRSQPSLEIPDNIEYLKKNIDGSGITLEQQIKKVIAACSSIGRSGLLTDYSKPSGAVSQQDIIDGKVRAVINRYDAENIVWVETKEVGVENVLSLVILRETYKINSDDGYKTTTSDQYKVLILGDYYYQEIWRQTDGKSTFEMIDQYAPTDNSGNLFTHIPFTFIGSLNNDSIFDEPPMLSIADLNIGHYRNSADAEEASFIVGQPTLALSGLTNSWVKDVLKGVAQIGSRGGIPLPEGGSATLLQVSGNTMPENGMKTKELQMSAIGAQLVSGNSGNKTATEINRDSSVENSVLSTITHNTEQAYNFSFEQVTLFTGVEIEPVKLNKEFSLGLFEPNVYTSILSGAMQGQNSEMEIFNYLKKTGMVDDDIDHETWKESIFNATPPALNNGE